MAKWVIINSNGFISKDNEGFDNLDVSFLPSDVLAVQSSDGVNAEIEKGNQGTETHSNNETVATSTLSWWSNVSTTWQTAKDAYEANNIDDDA